MPHDTKKKSIAAKTLTPELLHAIDGVCTSNLYSAKHSRFTQTRMLTQNVINNNHRHRHDHFHFRFHFYGN